MLSGIVGVERFEHKGASLIDEVLGRSTTEHIVFLHGWGASRDSLRGIGALFQHTHRVHLIDLPGFGDAPPPPPDWDTIHYADLMERYVLERLSGAIVLVGHSFGGRVSVRVAARRVATVRALVLMGVPGLPQPRFSRMGIRRASIRLLRRGLMAARPFVGQRGLDWHTRMYGSRDYLAAGVLRPVFVRVVNEDLTDSARAVRCPTLLLWGTDDTEAPPWLANRYRQLMGDRATLAWLPHKDHHPYTGTGAHLCAHKIRSWLQAGADA